MDSHVKNAETEAECRRQEISVQKARRAEKLDAYIAAFIDTPQEFSAALGSASIECWLNEERQDEG